MQGNPAPRRETGERPAPTIASRPTGGGGLGTDFDCDGGLIAFGTKDYGQNATNDGGGNLAIAFNWQNGGGYGEAHDGLAVTEDGTGPLSRSQVAAVAYDMRGRNGGSQFEGPHDTANIRAASGGSSKSYVAASCVRRLTPQECERLQGFPDDHTLIPYRGSHANAGGQVAVARIYQDSEFGVAGYESAGSLRAGRIPEHQMLIQRAAVRRLTPRECERLQGFPDDYTLIPYRGKPAADGPRYKALGNSIAVPVLRWVGQRIEMVTREASRAA